jgi:hypothetical protein
LPAATAAVNAARRCRPVRAVVSFRPVPLTPFRVPRLLTPGAALALAVLAACGGKPVPPPAAAVPQAPARPLARLAAQPILVLPLQAVYPADSLGWYARIEDERAFRRRVDDEITFALGTRGATATWIMPETVARVARRNPTLAPDPYALSAAPLAPDIVLKDDYIPEPLATQLRSLVALGEARYVLVPVDVRFLRADGGGVASMHVKLVDARAASVRGAFDVRTDTVTTFSEPAIATRLAEKFADLIAAP